MPDVHYYIASSLDGCIATPDHGIEWLAPFQQSGDDYGFNDFYASIDALLLGSRTYEVALKQGLWPAPDKRSWVFTERELPVAHPSITLTSEEPARVLEQLAGRGFERAWLMGGGALAGSFLAQGLISCLTVALIPVLLGAGIPMFAEPSGRETLTLHDAKSYPSGVVSLRYERRP
jgi:dihydrofolate reductase